MCPRRCHARRDAFRGEGACGAGTVPRVAKAALHFGEEPPLCGTGGSGAVFFCGCALKCVYCQNAPISQITPDAYGRHCAPDELGQVFDRLAMDGAENINLVGATPYLPAVLEALRLSRRKIPVVYNTSGYETVETINALAPFVDVWLPDYKYADSEGALLLSGAADYPRVAIDAIAVMRGISGPARYDGRGVMTRGTIVRHLILPGRIRESMLALNALVECIPLDTPLSLMGQFTPCHRSAEYGMNRPISRAAWLRVKAHRIAVGFVEGWNQPPDASGTSMIPEWDMGR